MSDLNRHPARVGAYEVVAPIAVGGMAEVYLCRKTGPGGFEKHVACKVVHPKVRHDQVYQSMFLDEARVSALMHHPNLIHVYEIAEQDGLPYMAMEFVQGPSLSRLIRDASRAGRPPSFPMLAAIFAQICAGLHAAHAVTDAEGRPLHLVHRDLTPQNVLVSLDGVVKVIDFGVAKQDQQLQLTEVGVIKGKLSYLSPEQLSGREVDRRVDVYSVAVSMYWAATGQLPFRADTPQDLWRLRMDGRFPPPRALNPQIPEAFEALILRGMAERPEDRFATADELRRSLEGLSGGLGATDLAAWVAQVYPDPSLWTARSLRPMPAASTDTFVVGRSEADAPELLASPSVTPSSFRSVPARAPRAVGLGLGIAVSLSLAALAAWWPDPSPVPLPLAPPLVAVESTASVPAPAPAPAPAPPAAPDPEPAPTVVPLAPAVVPPAPAPPPRPARAKPAAAASAGSGRVLVSGDGDVSLVRGSEHHRPGSAVPAGTWKVVVTFPGQNPRGTGTVTVPDGGTVSLKCNAAFFKCAVAP